MKYSTILLLFCSLFAAAQPATGTLFKCNAYVCDIDALDMPDGHLSFKNFKFINGDNRTGYNCNPAWSGEGNKNILFLGVSNDMKQADTYAFDLDNSTKQRLTWTEDESELVPRPMWDYTHCTALTTEKTKLQRIHKFPIDASLNPTIFGGELTNCGNFIWLNLLGMAAFLNDNNNVVYIDAKTGDMERISAQCTSNLQMNPRGDLIFLYKKTAEEWSLKLYDRKTQRNRTLCSTLAPNIENFTVLPDNSIICAKGSKVYRIFPDRSPEWIVAADLQDAGIHKVTQLICNKNGKLAIIAE